jgi:predicted acetyltransferase
MNISIELIKKDEKEILRNLLEKWDYEFSQYNKKDVNNLGLFVYDYMDEFDKYWTEENRYPYFIRIENKLAGFIIVNDSPINGLETKWTMVDFFVMYKYRKMGIGTFSVKNVFEKHKGKWGLKYHPKNEVSEKFWNKIIGEYTKGKYEIIKNNPETIYEDGTIGHVLIFET